MKKDHVQLAANALSDLNIFYAIIAILEGGTIRTPSNRAASRIINICKSEAGKRLRDYDRMRKALEEMKG